MTTTSVTPRPNRIKFSGHTADDGLFGPDSVTWRISALPQMGCNAEDVPATEKDPYAYIEV